MNQAMLAKASWRMVQKDEGLWSRIYKKKYLVHSSLSQDYRKTASCSSTWASIAFGAELLRRGLKWRVGNGRSINFWKDVWTDYGRLEEHAAGSCEDLTERVCDYWGVQGWQTGKLSRVLPEEIVNHICAIPVGQEDMEDKLIWGATPNGIFSVKTAYLLNFAEDCQVNSPWVQIWKINIPPKLKTFLWTLMSGKLLTNVQRAARKFTGDPSCFHCPGYPESLLHLFRDCPKAKVVWDDFNIPDRMKSTFGMDWKGWHYANLLQQNCMIFNCPWNVFFSFVVWYLWKWRCCCIFDSSFNLPFNAGGVICDYLEEWRSANTKEQKVKVGEDRLVCWHKPLPGFVKLNVDGARNREGAIGAGGVIRDCAGDWLGGFMATMGVGEVLQAEAWALFHGLKMAAELNISHLNVETDSSVLVCLLKDDLLDVHPLGNLLQSCSRLMQKFVTCTLRHVLREENGVADVIAKASVEGQLGCQMLKEAPQFAASVLLDDVEGKGKMRHFHPALQPYYTSLA